MTVEYVLFMRSEVVETYRNLRRAEKDPLAQFFDLLENFPSLAGETTERHLAAVLSTKLRRSEEHTSELQSQ